MRPMSDEECRRWCAERRIATTDRPHVELRFAEGISGEVYVGGVDEGAQPSYETAEALFNPERAKAFPGGLLWGPGGGPVAAQRTVHRRFLAGCGVAEAVHGQAGVLFDPAEFDDAVALFALFVDFSWPCYWVPAHGAYLFRTCNDWLIDVAIATEEWDRRFRPLLEAFEWEGTTPLARSLRATFFP